MKDWIIRKASEKYHTPLYIFDTDTLGKRFEFFAEAMGSDIKINYCMKTNPFLTRASLEYTDRIEVCSYGEFLICKELCIPPEKLLISGVLKKKEDLREIMEYCGAEALYTAESSRQWESLNKIAISMGIRVKVYMRLCCGQFGMDEETIISLLKQGECRGVEFFGIHYFTGTQKRDLKKHEKEIRRLDDLFRRIEEETGYRVKNLEYGTGFGVAYFMDQEEVFTAEVLREFKDLLLGMSWHGNISLEMGRALAYDSGYYITRVRDLKETEGKSICICDGGIHQINYDGQLRGMYAPHTRVIRKAEEAGSEDKKYIVYGSLCTTNDVLLTGFETSELNEGDLLVFMRTGAYSVCEGMSLFLSHELPGVCLFSEQGGIVQVRRQCETYGFNTICYEKERQGKENVR